ncbi:NAD(P)H-dependent oxidoreductase [Sneathiella glossodoripedis]|uniref:NAD(P)H-dependent oxidoreductase n=1 Tax=Sneathiella glossodoripedis TaxID=418853 RepID=UPI001900E57A|nr:NAD(P)H-dependent oxidoreductase [Sneathiella glossodoripedis]
MTSKHILALNGHPADNSLSSGLITSYQRGAEQAGHQVRRYNLGEMTFDPDFGDGNYEHSKPLEEGLQRFVEDLKWCDHLVIAMPLWWGGIPSKLKGLIDRTLLPGIAFDTRNKSLLGLPAPLLTGKTGSILLTSDTPSCPVRIL